MVRGEVVVLSSTQNVEAWICRLLKQRSYGLRSHRVDANVRPQEGAALSQGNAKALIIADVSMQRWTESWARIAQVPLLWAVPQCDEQTLDRALRAGVQGVLAADQDLSLSIFLLETAIRNGEQERVQRERAEKALRDLDNRKQIERAKGVLMERYGLSEADAFKQLRSEAMSSRKSMVEIAESVLLVEKLAPISSC